MVVLPGSIRSSFEGFVEEASKDPRVCCIGLFGSWARGDASDASDYDLLVVEKTGANYEFNELVQRDGLSLDLTRIPWSWVGGVVSPGVDHRLLEAHILYDPDDVLRRARDFVDRNFRAPRRVEVRADGYLTTSEMYLSRASAAFTRGDLETASVCVDFCLVPVAHFLMDIAGIPVTRRALVWDLRRACLRLGMGEVYEAFFELSRLVGLDSGIVGGLVSRFEDVWGLVSGYLGERASLVGGLHEKLRRDIGYLTDPLVLAGILGRAGEMLDQANFVEAAVYMRGWLFPLLEGYAWAVSAGQGEKYDYTSLFRVIGEGGIRDGTLEVFGLGGLEAGWVGGALDGARSLLGDVRLDRRRLIEGFVA